MMNGWEGTLMKYGDRDSQTERHIERRRNRRNLHCGDGSMSTVKEMGKKWKSIPTLVCFRVITTTKGEHVVQIE